MTAKIGNRATFATPAKRGWFIRSAEGSRMTGMHALPTPEARRRAVVALMRSVR